MDRSELRSLFDSWAGRYGRAVRGGHPMYARYEDVLEAVAERAAAPGRLVLELGCGTGNLTLRLLERGARVVALDLSRNMLREAGGLLADAPGLLLAHAEDPFLRAPFADATFDAVASTYAFHHVEQADKPACLAEVRRLLKPGGRFVCGDLAFANANAEQAALRQFAEWLEPEPFARLDELAAAISERGGELWREQFGPVTWVFGASL